jgi:hypothetical protein
MDNKTKAEIYDECIRESDKLQNINSKIKSQYVTNIPTELQKTIDENNKKISKLVLRLESLFK